MGQQNRLIAPHNIAEIVRMAIQATLNVVCISFGHISTSNILLGFAFSLYSAGLTGFATKKNKKPE
jgi:hypothetical protein